jgi:hypothetical protein
MSRSELGLKRYTKTVSFHEDECPNELENMEEMDKNLDTCGLSKLKQKYINNLKSNKIEAIASLPKKKS